jgi:selenocysteine-specific translation elongation factor
LEYRYHFSRQNSISDAGSKHCGTKKLIKNTAASNYKFVDPVSESRSRARVGLAAKGVDADDISRGDVLCSPNLSNINLVTDSIAAGFTKSPYYKGNLTENQTYIISVGTQIKPVKVKNINNNTIEIIPEKPIVYFSSQPYALIKPDNIGTRIIGKGTMQ